ncbi:hypothetical protein HaLaN_24771, partial [Haematococcus lacustris]
MEACQFHPGNAHVFLSIHWQLVWGSCCGRRAAGECASISAAPFESGVWMAFGLSVARGPRASRVSLEKHRLSRWPLLSLQCGGSDK